MKACGKDFLSRNNLIITVLFVLVACVSHDRDPVASIRNCAGVTGMQLTPAVATATVGDAVRFRALFVPPCYSSQGVVLGPFQWSSSDTAVATVASDSGTVMARAPGEANIVVKRIGEPGTAAALLVVVRR